MNEEQASGIEVKKTSWQHYRQLKKDEVIEEDDEVYDDERGWRKTIVAGSLAPDPYQMAHRIYRRKIIE